MPHTSSLPAFVSGKVLPENSKAFDALGDIVLYGCNSMVMITESTGKLVKVYDGHMQAVTFIRFRPDFHHSPYTWAPDIASGDASGAVHIWNVSTTTVRQIQEPGRVDALEWHPQIENILLVFNRPAHEKSFGKIVLWNTSDKGDKLWQYVFDGLSECVSVSFSVFDHKLALVGFPNGKLAYINCDFSTKSPPTSVILSKVDSSLSAEENKRTRSKAKTIDSLLKGIVFSIHFRQVAYIVLARDIVIFDLEHFQPVGGIKLDAFDSNRDNFEAISLAMNLEEKVFCLHADASVTVWNKKLNSFDYSLCCQSMPSQCTTGGLIISTSRETLISAKQISHEFAIREAVPLSSFSNLKKNTEPSSHNLSKNSSPQTSKDFYKKNGTAFALSNTSIVSKTNEENNESIRVSVFSECGAFDIYEYLPTPETIVSSKQRVHNNVGHFSQVHSRTPLALNPIKLLASPTNPNVLVVVTEDATIQLIDHKRNLIVREYMCKGFPISGAVWFKEDKIFIFGSERTQSKTFINHVAVVNLSTGQVYAFRTGNQDEMHRILSIHVSRSGKYFSLILKNGYAELWTSNFTSYKLRLANYIPTAFCWGNKTKKDQSNINDPGECFYLGVRSTSETNGKLLSGVFNGTKTEQLSEIEVAAAPISYIEQASSSNLFLKDANSIKQFDYKSRRLKVFLKKPALQKISVKCINHKLFVGTLGLTGELTIYEKEYPGNNDVTAMTSNWLIKHKLCGQDFVIMEHSVVVLTDGQLVSLNHKLHFSNIPSIPSHSFLNPIENVIKKSLLLNESLENITKLGDKKKIFFESRACNKFDYLKEVAKEFSNPRDVVFWLLCERLFSANLSLEKNDNKSKDENLTLFEKVMNQEGSKKAQDITKETSSFESTTISPALYYLLPIQENERSHKPSASSLDGMKQSNNLIMLDKRIEALALLRMSGRKQGQINREAIYKACLLSAFVSESQLLDTVIYASNEFAHEGDIDEAASLLCLVGRISSGCTLLTDAGRWADAYWLATHIKHRETQQVLIEIATHYAQSNMKSLAIEIFLSLGLYEKVLEFLLLSQTYEIGSIFVLECQKRKLILNHNSKLYARAILSNYAAFLEYIGLNELSNRYKSHSEQILAEIKEEQGIEEH